MRKQQYGAVVFDGSVLAAGPVTGVAGAFLTTLQAYGALAREAGDPTPVLLVPRGVEPPRLDGIRVERGPRGAMRKQWQLPRLLRRLGARLLHSPVAALPVRARCPMVATVHDLPWTAEEDLHEPGNGWRHRWAVRLAARRAAAILVPSEATARSLQEDGHHGYRLPRVCVSHHGVVQPASPAPENGLTGPFLVLGDDRPRKNIPRVLEAHRRARELDPSLPDLRICGPVHGYVSEAEKLRLLRSCRALLGITLFEGFGLPVLEAFAHGVPVVCSNRGSLLEVAGDAALVVDPTDVDAMADAIVRVHQDEALRHTLRQRGLDRAATHTPDAAARDWRQLHQEVCS